ncbi:MAG TPA: phosphatase PAP2 family protein [Planctomycetota bacterium]|nr:phosphatase PAP2 family protein [Planctomycetota bacterium]
MPDASNAAAASPPPRLWPVDRLTLAFFGVCLSATAATGGRVERAGAWIALDLAALLGIAVLYAVGPRISPRAQALWRLLHGCVFVPTVFTQVGFLIKALRGADYAVRLAAIDRRLFGGRDPLEALEAIATPWLTEAMQWAYTSYLLMPAAAVILIAVKAPPAATSRAAFSLLGVMYLSYVGYWIVPAGGPNLHNNFGPLLDVSAAYPYPVHRDLYTFRTDLPGTWLADELRLWMFRAELTKQDCFPSGHAAVAVTCWGVARRLGRVYGLWFAPFALGVVLSTVYLRYHYVIDVIAGVLLAAYCLGPFLRLHDRWARAATAA